jgi:hypothetical protein
MLNDPYSGFIQFRINSMIPLPLNIMVQEKILTRALLQKGRMTRIKRASLQRFEICLVRTKAQGKPIKKHKIVTSRPNLRERHVRT